MVKIVVRVWSSLPGRQSIPVAVDLPRDTRLTRSQPPGRTSVNGSRSKKVETYPDLEIYGVCYIPPVV